MQLRILAFIFSLLLGIGSVSLVRSVSALLVLPTQIYCCLVDVPPIEPDHPGEILLTDKKPDMEMRELSPLEDAFNGWYSFEGSKGLKDVNLLFISRDGGQDAEVGAAVFTNFETEDAGFIEASWVKLEGNQVSFRTKKIRGFEFEFRGEFFKNKMMGEEGEEILRGTVSQFRGKELVAKAAGDFKYYEPQCWH